VNESQKIKRKVTSIFIDPDILSLASQIAGRKRLKMCQFWETAVIEYAEKRGLIEPGGP
jgi:hypothetical protein